MIYLIGGAPRCGKTILAKKIILKKKMSWITTDAIRPAILEYIPKSEIIKKFPYESSRNQFNLKSEITEARSMWSGVKALIQQLINCKQDYVIEGVHLLPQFINQLRNTRYWKNIKVVYLIKKDLKQITKGLTKNKKEFDWLAGAIKNKDDLIKKAKTIKIISKYFEEQAKKYKFEIINTDIEFNKTINKYIISF